MTWKRGHGSSKWTAPQKSIISSIEEAHKEISQIISRDPVYGRAFDIRIESREVTKWKTVKEGQ